MGRYLLTRLLTIIPMVILVSLTGFILLYLAPGDPAEMYAGDAATKETVAQLRAEMGLDKSLPLQYLAFLKAAAHGDFGESYMTRRPVLQEIRRTFPATLELAVWSTLVAILVGIPAGVYSGVYRGRWTEKLVRTISLVGVTTPIFWLGLMLIWLFAVKWHLLPPSGRGGWEHLILPAVSLATPTTALLVRLTSSSLLEVMRENYVATARSKGLAERTVIYKHALKNAAIPVITVIGLQFGTLLGGAVLTETIFAWPGIGRLVVEAVFARDYPMVRGLLIFACVVFMVINVLVDLLYAYLDPRISYQ